MAVSFRVASYNVENLFTRAKLLNFSDNATGDPKLDKVEDLKDELCKTSYDKPKILSLYNDLKEYIEVVEQREKLFDRYKKKVVASGRDDWEGFIRFKREQFEVEAQKNTAKIIKTVDADLLCLVEIEGRPTLKAFAADLLKKTTTFARYDCFMSIDGNDDRGIDLGIASRWAICDLYSHVDDTDAKGEVFSRDCLEVRLEHSSGLAVTMLLNHFKSKGYSGAADPEGGAKRKRQATRLAKILNDKYDLTKDLVIVCGDLNDTPTSAALAPLMAVNNLTDVLAQQFPNEADRWTYHYKKNEQIDYLLVSKPLANKLQNADVLRRGIFEVDKFTNGAIKPLTSVDSYIHSASDHGAVWADFSV